MKLPSVFPANLVKKALALEETHPGRLGVIFGQDGKCNPRGLPYALDNGRFPVWAKGKEWVSEEYEHLLAYVAKLPYPPIWAAVPDVVADADATFSEWSMWYPRLAKMNCPLALVVQDGMNPPDVKKLRPRPDVIFVGGSTQWKWRTLPTWAKHFPRVHVGRVNTYSGLWAAHRAGAESSDGTGWYYRKQSAQLDRYLRRSDAGESEFDYKGLVY